MQIKDKQTLVGTALDLWGNNPCLETINGVMNALLQANDLTGYDTLDDFKLTFTVSNKKTKATRKIIMTRDKSTGLEFKVVHNKKSK